MRYDIAHALDTLELKSEKIRSLTFALYAAIYECENIDRSEFIGAYDVLEDLVIDLNRELSLLTKQAFEELRADKAAAEEEAAREGEVTVL